MTLRPYVRNSENARKPIIMCGRVAITRNKDYFYDVFYLIFEDSILHHQTNEIATSFIDCSARTSINKRRYTMKDGNLKGVSTPAKKWNNQGSCIKI